MHASARPISRFANYETSGNDTHDRVWAERLKESGTDPASVELRPCLPTVTMGHRFITENELITRVVNGDKHAALWFEHRCERLVTTIVRDMPFSAHERNDVFQQMFAKLCEQDHRRLRLWLARGKGRLTSYLSTVIRRTAYDWLRKHLRTTTRTAFRIVDYIETEWPRKPRAARRVPTALSPTIVVDTEALTKLRDQTRAIRRAVTEMLHCDSEILRRRYYYGQSHSEIAEAMGMTVKGVSVGLSRAQKRMHNKLCLLYPGLF